MSRAMRVLRTRVIVIVAIMELRDRRVEEEKDTVMATIIAIITIMAKTMVMERADPGVRMHMRECPSLRMEALRIRVRCSDSTATSYGL